MTISIQQFGQLFHGSGVPGLTSIDQTEGAVNFAAMPEIYGHNFATTDFDTAREYAKQSKGGVPTVYRVSPTDRRYWSPDPHSGPGGWYDGPKNRREALDIHEGGGEVSLRFGAPLRVEDVVWQEHNAQDITPYDRSFS